MRIDLVLATQVLADQVRFALVDRNARKGKQPSDHAPVVVEVQYPSALLSFDEPDERLR
jgi:exodeoxyribonuclease-3